MKIMIGFMLFLTGVCCLAVVKTALNFWFDKDEKCIFQVGKYSFFLWTLPLRGDMFCEAKRFRVFYTIAVVILVVWSANLGISLFIETILS